MRFSIFSRQPAPAARRRRLSKAAQGCARAALSLSLLCQAVFFGAAAPARAAKPAAQQGATGQTIQITQRAVASFTQLAREEALNPASAGAEELRSIPPPRPLPYEEDPHAQGGEGPAPSTGVTAAPSGGTSGAPSTGLSVAPEGEDEPQPSVPSPTPSQSYHAQEDGPRIGATARFIPPDIHGAVGLARSMSVTNNNYRVYDKATGAPVTSVGIQTFWSPLAPHPAPGDNGLFDPRVQYDPYNDRFIHWVLAGSISANNELLIAVSQTGDPAGTYNYYSFVVGTSNLGADFPTVGFNKNWLVVGLNMFAVASGGVTQGNLITIDYPAVRAGASSPTAVRFVTPDNTFFFGTGLCPADTYDPNEGTMYFVRNFNNNTTGRLQMYRVTGGPATPAVSIVNDMINSGDFWNTGSEGNFLPQLNTSSTVGAPSSTLGIESGDARIQNVVYRNGSVWAVHKIGIPATINTATVRVGVQWWQLSTTGAITQRGRVEDPSATQANGGKHYAWPAIAVNKNNDVVINFSEFEEDDYADTAYAVRLAADPVNTTRDPVVYAEGLDNYAAADSNGRVRWGDYTMAVPDPSNDRDMWALGEYAHLKVPVTGGFSSRHDTWWAKVSLPAGAGELVISEFRLRGPNGDNDEYIEIYNTAATSHTVTTIDGSAGYAIAASDGVVRCTIPAGTVIPARGHYLCVNSVGYSQANYPAGNGTTATGDATYTLNIPVNTGIALFNTANVLNFAAATRLDAVGSVSEPNALYKEGAGHPDINPTFNVDYALVRDLVTGQPKDTNNNEADFDVVDTNGTNMCTTTPLFQCQRLGAPGPENLSSPGNRFGSVAINSLDSCVAPASPPNRVRTLCPCSGVGCLCAAQNATFGTLSIRRTFVNTSGAPITRLRFRVTDMTTFPVPTGTADLRLVTSANAVTPDAPYTVTVDRPPCGSGTSSVIVQPTTLEQGGLGQPNGGGFNSTVSAGTVTLATPLLPGTEINLQFLLGVQQVGSFRFFVTIEALP
jgi:hypothetical protein